MPEPLSPVPAACIVVDDEPRHDITLGVTTAVSAANAPVPRSSGERLVFAQLYETLVRVDCAHQVTAGLADEWSSDDGRTWRFGIRSDATFTDGSPVTARSVIEAWSSAPAAALAAVTALGDHELSITLHMPSDARAFASPDLAIARPAESPWPVGTGAFRLDGSTRMVDGAGRTVELGVFASDARNALDTGVDALVSADAATLAYARARSDYTVTPLLWSRTWVIVTQVTSRLAAPPADSMAALGKDAVRADTRPPAGSYWWQECAAEQAPAPARERAPSNAVVYPRGDGIARGIAERIVALAWPAERAPAWLRAVLPARYGSGPAPHALAIDERELVDFVAARTPLAIVMALPRVSYARCSSVPWRAVTQLLNGVGTSGSWHATPLLDVRDYLIHRPGLGRVLVDGDGTIRLSRAP